MGETATTTRRDKLAPWIKPERWGKDHWTTLAYIETVIVDYTEYRIHNDPRMRTGRHHIRIRMMQGSINGVIGDYPTRLKGGDMNNHDDWDCLQDGWHYGLVDIEGHPSDWLDVRDTQKKFKYTYPVELGAPVTLTDLGHAVLAELRKHKASGDNYHFFMPSNDLLTQMHAFAENHNP